MKIYFLYYTVITMFSVFLTNYMVFFSDNRKYVFSRTRKLRNQTVFLTVLASALLILIIGFRSEHNGLDLHNTLGTGYFYYYQKINEDSVLEILGNFGKQKYANFEIGFCLFCKFIGTICSNQQILLFACALVSIIPIGYFISRNSKNIWLSIMIYLAMPFFGTAYFSAIRQGIAIGLVVFSIEFIKRKKWFSFLVIVLIACTFHSSALVAFILYPVYHFRMNQKSAFYGGVGTLIAIFILKGPLFQLLSGLLASNAEIVKSRAINFFLLLTVLYAFCVLFGDRKNDMICGYTNIFWLACAAQAFSGINNLAGRVTWYFMPTLIVLIPNIVLTINIKEKGIRKYLIWIIGIMACLVGLYFLRNDMVAVAYPYEPFWVE